MKNGLCQLFLKFASWVTEFWIRWPDYYGCAGADNEDVIMIGEEIWVIDYER